MWSQWMVDSWGYGGYGPFHMIIWMILGDCRRSWCRMAHREGATEKKSFSIVVQARLRSTA
jgi:hypothetical protein